jgi:hypothetical protein
MSNLRRKLVALLVWGSLRVLSLLPSANVLSHWELRATRLTAQVLNGRFKRSTRTSRLYVWQQSVFQPDVLGYLARQSYRKALYIIVGVKIGRDAKVTHTKTREVGGNLNATVPLAPAGVPADLAGKLHGRKHEYTCERKNIPGSFVFAYRLREIRHSKKTDLAKDVEYTKNADLHDLHGKNVIHHSIAREPTYIGTVDEIELEGISVADFEEDRDNTTIVDGCVMVDKV